MARPDMPYPKLTVAAIVMCAAMDEKARFRCSSSWKKRNQNQTDNEYSHIELVNLNCLPGAPSLPPFFAGRVGKLSLHR